MSNQTQPTQKRRGMGISPQMIVGLIAGLYTISPIDVMPDFVPVLGQMDDIGMILLAVVAMLVMSLSQRSDSDE